MAELEKKLAEIIAEAMKIAIRPLRDRIEALEQRPAAGGCSYAGTWTADKTYPCGVLCTRNGGLWLSLASTKGDVPGHSGVWKLVVKSGGG